MTGRARGTPAGRGRGRGVAPPPGQLPTGRGGPATTDELPRPGGRGRGRAGPPVQPPTELPRPGDGGARPPLQQAANVPQPPQSPNPVLPDPTPDRSFIEPGTETRGSAGSAIEARTNYFVIKAEGTTVYQYSVSFEPDGLSEDLRQLIITQNPGLLGPTLLLDGHMLYLPIKLPDPVTTFATTTKAGDHIQTTIQFANELSANSSHGLHLIRRLFPRILKEIQVQSIGNEYYNLSKKIDLRAHALEIYPGYQLELLQNEKDIGLRVGQHFLIKHSNTVLQHLYEIYDGVDRAQFYEIAKKKIVGSTVLTSYDNTTYRVLDIDFNKNPTTDIKLIDGRTVKLKEQVLKDFGKEVKDEQQPILVVMAMGATDEDSYYTPETDKEGIQRIDPLINPTTLQNAPRLILPEFCSRIGFTDDEKANFSIMKDVAQHTRLSPEDTAENIGKLVSAINENNEARQILGAWNMQFEGNLLKLNGRSLPIESMFTKTEKFSYDAKTADWSRETRGKELISPVNLDNWLLLYTDRDTKVAGDFEQTYKRVAGPMGINVKDPIKRALANDSAREFTEALKENIKPGLQLVVAIVPNNRKDRADAIIQVACVEKPVPIQIIVSRTLSKQQMLMSVCTKTANCINTKLGGELWALDIPIQNVMVVGISARKSKKVKGKTWFSTVASTNGYLTRYYSQVGAYRSFLEIGDQLKVHFTGALKKYNELNGRFPDRIITYRMTPGAGRLNDVMDHEILKLKASFGDFQAGYDPKFAFVVVNPATPVRFFAQNQEGQLANPLPGTIFDSTVTRPQWYDFYLISQAVRQGTVAPTHYNVITDTSGLQPDHIQKLTYKLAHLDYSDPSSTAWMPAPLMYADRLADFLAASFQTEPDVVLQDRLFFNQVQRPADHEDNASSYQF